MQKQLAILCFWGLFLLVSACGGESPSQGQNGNDQTQDTSATGDNSGTAASEPACDLKTPVLDGNRIFMRQTQRMVVITADSSTYDDELGDSHRILEVYNTSNCQIADRKVLEVNESPDFPYYLAQINYNNSSTLVGIRGASNIYCYDVGNLRLSNPIQPGFLRERYSEDAQSGHILRLEVWEDFLVGFAQDKGVFAVSVEKTAMQASPVLPIAEFQTGEGQYSSLFAFSFPEGKSQLAIPSYDIDADEFSVNPLFDQPLAVNTTLGSNVRNNRYLVLPLQGQSGAVAIDMQEKKRIELPADVETQSVQNILRWIRANVK
ncbi:MAG: hypothetical protein H6562_02185 [Lewinellaceae bacterium]|nr:hypothetical protein [Lewinella sp.]MCB9277701.1 hypothetical protein [Lewinellaceae bacterium]